MSLKIWKNTATLDEYSQGLDFTEKKQNADIALLGSKPIEIDEFPGLKGIFRAGIGRDNVPVVAAEAQGIKVRFPTPETVNIIYEETADFTCSLIFQMNYQEVGTLDPWVKFSRVELNQKRLLVVGNGNIGKRVAYKMKRFMEVVRYDITSHTLHDLQTFLASSDFVSLHIPNLPENSAFFNMEKLAMMKDGAVLINTARGPIVDENALEFELEKGRMRAAFDVFWKEPYQGRLKRFHPRSFFMTPHVASTCVGFLQGCRRDLNQLIEDISND